jgi:hypothetical protein
VSELLDRYVPAWEFSEVHRRRVSAPPERVLDALFELQPVDLPLTGVLMAIRMVPTALARRRLPVSAREGVVDGMKRMGFFELARADDELVLGAIGQFWRPRAELEPIADAEEFVAFNRPGFLKAAVTFHASPYEGGTLLVTETRVHAIDERARRAFRPYWVPVRIAGEVIRRELLWAIARRAERGRSIRSG